ncbi:TetR/AcrR family transcriptional regulator [Actinocorallia longicatena]|uniref:HTH tetR-type domain-containing protein n=1 Tax=Actinocorallia longicatena TaxID=111803 RepID=A0ABP6QIS2_9ACTN
MNESDAQLAGEYGADRPGLPRGRARLPVDVVRREQRRRLLRAVISAVAGKGYAHTTVGDVVARARVSRKAFYEHFRDLEHAFLSACAGAERQVVKDLSGAAREGVTAEEMLRDGLRAYLRLVEREPEFTRCLLVELPPVALEGRVAAHRRVGDLLRIWRDFAHPSRPPLPDALYLAAVGAIAELLTAHLGEPATALEEPAWEILRRLLA